MMKVSSSSLQRPLILTNLSSPKIFAYYSVYWEQNQSNILTNNNMRFEINSCLYFQTNTNDDDDEWEETREDGCGYIIIYPPHIRPDLDVYSNSKNYFLNRI
jgi:hypothetical protein